jgi:hypothetical protein
MTNRRTAIVLVLVLFCALTPVTTLAAQTGSITSLVSGLIANGGGSFTGRLAITGFSVVNGVLTATGTLSGTLTDALGNVINTVTNIPVSIPLAGVSGTCQILSLTLGPLDLNLLGLMVHLNQVVLNITAQSGPGNLLGNLLCAVSHLLDSNSSLTALSELLNHILGAL